jgi:hypothetical protein
MSIVFAVHRVAVSASAVGKAPCVAFSVENKFSDALQVHVIEEPQKLVEIDKLQVEIAAQESQLASIPDFQSKFAKQEKALSLVRTVADENRALKEKLAQSVQHYSEAQVVLKKQAADLVQKEQALMQQLLSQQKDAAQNEINQRALKMNIELQERVAGSELKLAGLELKLASTMDQNLTLKSCFVELMTLQNKSISVFAKALGSFD